MQALDLITTTQAYLTRTEKLADGNIVSYLCDVDGNRLDKATPGLPIYKDRFTGKTFVRLAETIPSLNTHKAEADAIFEKKPIHFADDRARGWFIEAPDFNERDAK